MTKMQSWSVGELRITKLFEQWISLPAEALFPEVTEQHLTTFSSGMTLQSPLKLSVHSWLVESPQGRFLIDTASGNDKSRPSSPLFDRLNSPWMENFLATGLRPEDIDYVLHTHLHIDHVGWNTRWDGTQWVPTFPNARWIIAQEEIDWHQTPAAASQEVIFADSVQPLIEAGKVQTIAGSGGEILPGIHFLPTHGHSACHMSIAFESAGEMALFTGDVMHSQLQVANPDLVSVFCLDKDAARRSRMWLLDYATSHNATLFSVHFNDSAVGRLSKVPDGYRWTAI
ncbi:MBL fold metallo-hydrolase [Erwinia psidii]|uniref:MBL fold metallo-hydrolase n=1 Tax=Erwinia psidii TaxID=69224 RepID=A0A3N6SI70_9GAMM|nr:MBL fold metallo-hydrolase [Erwinia psidii]MCX8957846.1 MBL fold metallo-hydrolase [Erwinia psidii]MCX8960896.1 MBL fold metallo-hydrolase [Erwinia psidii]MCX8964864.1 MBL fold metallo-hydrolase [Erwinia psidii]RQM38461.1 MBL fold metallo-hydrolase [Erwinia psidii]